MQKKHNQNTTKVYHYWLSFTMPLNLKDTYRQAAIDIVVGHGVADEVLNQIEETENNTNTPESNKEQETILNACAVVCTAKSMLVLQLFSAKFLVMFI